MIGRFGLVAAVCSVGLVMAAGAAKAEESVSILGTNPAQTCSNAAGIATQTRTTSQKGIDACDEAIKNAPLSHPDLVATYLNRGVLHMATSNYAAAIADDEAALRLQGDLTEAYINRGVALAAEKRYSDAVADYNHALTLSPKQPAQVYYNRALAREDLGDVKGAYFDYLKAAQLNPGWDRPKAELARFTVVHNAMG